MKELNERLVILLVVLIMVCLIACASMAFNSNPIKMYEGKIKPNNELALIAGQGYKESMTNYVGITIQKVDGRNVYSELSLRAAYVVYVTPGNHTLTLNTSLGNNLYSLQNKKQFDVNVEPGKAYQIIYKILKNKDDLFIKYDMCEIGSIENYKKYFEGNLVGKGRPVPCKRID